MEHKIPTKVVVSIQTTTQTLHLRSGVNSSKVVKGKWRVLEKTHGNGQLIKLNTFLLRGWTDHSEYIPSMGEKQIETVVTSYHPTMI